MITIAQKNLVTSSADFTVNIPSGLSNVTIVAVAVCNDGDGAHTTLDGAFTFGGTNMTNAHPSGGLNSVRNSPYQVDIWYLKNETRTGNQTMHWGHHGGISSFQGTVYILESTDTTTQLDVTSITGVGSSANPSLSITTSTDGCLLIEGLGYANAPTANAGQTIDQSTGSHMRIASELTGLAGTYTQDWIASAGTRAHMLIAVRPSDGHVLIAKTAKGSSSSGVTTDGVDTTGATSIQLAVSSYHIAPMPTISDSKGNTYTALSSYNDGTERIQMFYVENPTVGSGHTFTASGLSSFASIAVAAFKGGATSSSFDVENGNFSTGVTTVTTGSITPTQNNELILAAVNFNAAGDTVSINSGLNVLAQFAPGSGTNFGVALAAKTLGTAVAINPTWTAGSVSGGMAASIAAFKLAGGAPPAAIGRSFGVIIG